jgi:hypothetical protein
MNELRRMAYLDALGIDSYVSRSQLPGAAPTRRLALAFACPATDPGVAGDAAGVRVAPPAPHSTGIRPVSNAVGRQQQAVVAAARTGDSLPPGAAAPGVVAPGVVAPGEVAPRFSLVAMVAGDWLWLEELAGMPLTTEQVQLVQSMAQALLLNRTAPGRTAPGRALPDAASRGPAPRGPAPRGPARPVVEQFDWPIHTNHQLDLGAEAAQASVAGFVGRRLDQYDCRGLVLLGQSCAARLPLQEINIPTVSTASSAQILEQPALKRTVWRDLLPLVSTL